MKKNLLYQSEAPAISQKVEVSVIIPMFNEEENLASTLEKVSSVLNAAELDWEILVVNDGSTDNTLKKAASFSRKEPRVRVISYSPNCGRGKALREGFKTATGDIICTLDADLSYDETYIVKMAKFLQENPVYDFVVGSPYVSGGGTENVPFVRLLISMLGNKILGYAMRGKLSTVTGILRAYRKECISALDLESDGKELNLEIVSKAIAMGFKAYEMPAVLRGRKKGRSKFRFKATALSHLIFSFYEKPVILFGLIGLALMLLGLAGGGYIVYLWQMQALNPERPLMTLMMILILTGMQILLFGFLGTQMVHLRKEVYRIQRENKKLEFEISQLPARIGSGNNKRKKYLFPDRV